MPIDFPNSPSVNDLFTSGSTSWKWDGTVWKVVRDFAPTGATGPTGNTGAVGNTGATGLTGINWTGQWDFVAYAVGDVVQYAGSSYYCVTAISSGDSASHVPGVSARWELLNSKGSTGATGPTGPTGAGLAPLSLAGIAASTTLSVGAVDVNFGYATSTAPWAEGQYVTFSDQNSNLVYSGKLRFQAAGGFGTAFGLGVLDSVTGSSVPSTSASWVMAFAAAPQGNTGVTGVTGNTGATGLTGANGNTGATGQTGATGPTGPDGIASVTGSLNYDTGTKELSLDEGVAGGLATLNASGVVPDEQLPADIVRTDGLTGALGDYIPVTEKGSTGGVAELDINGKVPVAQLPDEYGATGPTGPTGATGAGEPGPTGSIGPQGSAGPQGDGGQTGATGAAGQTGATGVTGAAGQTGATGVTGAQGETGATGNTGPTGNTGATGPEGSFGGATFRYDYDATSIVDADPGAGKIRLNSLTLSSASVLYIDDIDLDSNDIHQFLQTIDDSTSTIKGHFKISKQSDPTIFFLYAINSLVDDSNHFNVNCTYLAGNGSLSNGDDVFITFARTGDAGDQGPTGTTGATGNTGATGPTGENGTIGVDGATGSTGPTGIGDLLYLAATYR
jgi:collagen type VII alpha